ncbi:hypothetical protein J3B02_000103 [Coemansia erecta]|nr:hypothetical protein J3B02_000103 [Coemansia erecta]
MSANDFLDTLRTFDLEHQYPWDDIENLKALINELRAGMDMGGYDAHYAQPASAKAFSYQSKRHEHLSFGDSDEDGGIGRGRADVASAAAASASASAHGRPGGISRPGGQARAPGHRPSSIYGHSNSSSSGIVRSVAHGSAMSPPLQAAHHGSSSQVFGEPRTVGRQAHGSSTSHGPAMINRRQTLAPSSSHGFGFSRANESGVGSQSISGGDLGLGAGRSGPGAAPHRSRTVSARPTTASARGPRTGASNVNDILERSNSYAQAQRLAEDPDDDLEHVVRKTGQSGLVNAYGIPIRPTTAHAKRPGNDRRSLAPSGATNPGMRPKTAHRGARPDAGLGLSPKDMPSNLNDKIRVCVRKRPLNGKERDKGDKDIVFVSGCRTLSVMEPKVKVDMTKYIEESRFVFDEVFDEHAENAHVYERTAKPLVDYIFTGGNATCFAYGQTGSGKTYTMMDIQNGLYIQAAEDIFRLLERPQNCHLQVFVMFYEIYLSNLYDLLNERQKLFAREDANQNVVIQGVREVLIQSPADLMSVFEFGNNCRSTGSTGANADSSRSHAILQILLKDTNLRKPVVKGKLNFIDLAGNERGSDRGDKANKQTIMEGSEINKSLLALKECIRALDLNKKHQPFRQSKLTQVLKDSFIGNSRACMVATISPNTSNSENTLNTLRYSDRVKAMKSTGTASDGQQATSDGARDVDEYYGNELDDGYEDDSANRMYDEVSETSYGMPGSGPAFISSNHDAFREEDEYADDAAMEDTDEFASMSTTYQRHRRQQEQQKQEQKQQPQQPNCAYEHRGRSSFEERLDYDISEDAPSLIDEQPSFLDDGRQSLRSPRAYGSPAAKSFVASRMAVSPPSSRSLGQQQQQQQQKFSGSFIRSQRSIGDAKAYQQQQQQQQQYNSLQSRSSFEDDEASEIGRSANQPSSRRLVGLASGSNISSVNGGARGLRPPTMSRNNSVSHEAVGPADKEVAQHQMHRANAYSNSSTAASTDAYQATASSSPYTSAVSVPSEEHSPSGQESNGSSGSRHNGRNGQRDEEDAVMTSPVDDRGDAADTFGGLRIPDVEVLVNQHRAEIRATTEACKEETMLIAAYTSFTYAHLVQQSRNKGEGSRSRPNSWQQQHPQSLAERYYLDMSTGSVTRLADGLKFDSVDQAKMHEAMEYLEKLDEVLARKQQQVVDLRASIRKLVWDSAESATK